MVLERTRSRIFLSDSVAQFFSSHYRNCFSFHILTHFPDMMLIHSSSTLYRRRRRRKRRKRWRRRRRRSHVTNSAWRTVKMADNRLNSPSPRFHVYTSLRIFSSFFTPIVVHSFLFHIFLFLRVSALLRRVFPGEALDSYYNVSDL